MTTRLLARLLLAILVATPLLAHAAIPLILTAPPRETPAAAKKLYGPLAADLSKLIGRPVIYQYPGLYMGDWSTYTHRMQQGKFDLVFDGPQFVAWRMKYLHDIPLVSLPGHLDYVIATNNPNIKSMRQLIGRRVCGIDSPNLLTLSFLSLFRDPMLQPTIVAVDSGGMTAIYKAQLSGRCATAIYRESYFEHHLNKIQSSRLRVIYRSKLNMPNQTLTVSQAVSAKIRDRIVAQLTTTAGAKSAMPILNRFAKGATHFIASKHENFKGLANLLTAFGTVSGWVPSS